MSKEDNIKAINQDMAEAARAFGEAAKQCADAIGFGNWTSAWTCEEAAGSLWPVFGVDLNASGDVVYTVVVGYPRRDVDPMDRLVDGLTVRECLERYTAWQRTRDKQSGGNTVYWVDGARMVRPWDMTHEQVTAARLAWSAELKRKQQEAGEKERRGVAVDDDRWEE